VPEKDEGAVGIRGADRLLFVPERPYFSQVI